MSFAHSVSCFCINAKRPILSHCMDTAGRFLAVAVGEMGDWDGFDRYSLFVVDTADALRMPMQLDVAPPPPQDGVGGERFVSMRVSGGTLLVSRNERYMHWDGVEEQREAALMGFDLSSGARLKDLQSTPMEASVDEPEPVAQKFSWGSAQPEFNLIADEVQRVQGHRPERCLKGMRVGDALLVDYEVTEAHGVRQYLHVSVVGTSAALRIPGTIVTIGTSHFEAHGRAAVYTARANAYLCVIPLAVATPRLLEILERVCIRLDGAPIFPGNQPITRWDALPKEFLELLNARPAMRRTPMRYFPGISVETAGGGFLVGALAFFFLPMLLLFLFELVSVLRDWLKLGRGRWEGVFVFSLPVLFLGGCLWFAWRRWRRLRRLVERVRDGNMPFGLWLLEGHLIYRDQVDQCIVLARQHVRGIKTEFVGRARQWLLILERADTPQRVFIAVDAVTAFRGRPDELCLLLTRWWQSLEPF